MQYDYRNVTYNTRSTTQYDEGLRKYFLKIYQLMSAGLAITAIAAIAVFTLPTLTNLMFVTDGYGHYMGLTGFGWLISFAPLGISLYFAFGYDRISAENAQILFWIYAALVGMSLAALGLIYTGASIAFLGGGGQRFQRETILQRRCPYINCYKLYLRFSDIASYSSWRSNTCIICSRGHSLCGCDLFLLSYRCILVTCMITFPNMICFSPNMMCPCHPYIYM